MRTRTDIFAPHLLYSPEDGNWVTAFTGPGGIKTPANHWHIIKPASRPDSECRGLGALVMRLHAKRYPKFAVPHKFVDMQESTYVLGDPELDPFCPCNEEDKFWAIFWNQGRIYNRGRHEHWGPHYRRDWEAPSYDLDQD
jgi:hypothetical protein